MIQLQMLIRLKTWIYGEEVHIIPFTYSTYILLLFTKMTNLNTARISGFTIGNNVLVGAGAVVVKDAIEPGTYLGIPARKIQ